MVSFSFEPESLQAFSTDLPARVMYCRQWLTGKVHCKIDEGVLNKLRGCGIIHYCQKAKIKIVISKEFS
jgi:hypothetical protein